MGAKPNLKAHITVRKNSLLLNRTAQDLLNSGECEIQVTEDGLRFRPIRKSNIGHHKISFSRYIAIGKKKAQYRVEEGDVLEFIGALPGGMLEFRKTKPVEKVPV